MRHPFLNSCCNFHDLRHWQHHVGTAHNRDYPCLRPDTLPHPHRKRHFNLVIDNLLLPLSMNTTNWIDSIKFPGLT
jgi:hypothetical protein